MKATIYKIGKPRKDGSSLLYLAAYGKRSLWEHGPLGSFWYAKCTSETLTVMEAQACLEAIHQHLQVHGIIGQEPIPKFSWHAGATLINWTRA